MTTTELMMENQWICTSLMARYVSQRDAQRTGLAFHSTSYENRTFVSPAKNRADHCARSEAQLLCSASRTGFMPETARLPEGDIS